MYVWFFKCNLKLNNVCSFKTYPPQTFFFKSKRFFLNFKWHYKNTVNILESITKYAIFMYLCVVF